MAKVQKEELFPSIKMRVLSINTLAHTHARAKRDRDEFQRRVAQSVNQKLKLFNKIGQVILDEEIKDEELRTHIYDQIAPEELLISITECKSLVRSHGDNYYDFLALRYGYIRQFAPTFLISFHFHSKHQLNELLEAIAP